jgi:hypothetical protein
LYPNPYGLRGIERVSIPSKSKSLPIRINPLQSIWIENNRISSKEEFLYFFDASYSLWPVAFIDADDMAYITLENNPLCYS